MTSHNLLQNPNEQVRSVISAPPGRSIFDQPVEVQKWSKPDQGFLKTWLRANNAHLLVETSYKLFYHLSITFS